MQLFKSGALATDSLPNIIMLWGVTAESGTLTHLRAPFSTSGYQVTAGKTLYVVRIKINLFSGQGNFFKLGYADNAAAFSTGTLGSLANPVFAFGLPDNGHNGLLVQAGTNESYQQGLVFPWKFAIGSKYPFVQSVYLNPANGGYAYVFLWCVEL